MPEIDLFTSRNCPFRVLFNSAKKQDNIAMKKMIDCLKQMGLTEAEIRRVRKRYKNDEAGLALYVAYLRILLDDRREYAE